MNQPQPPTVTARRSRGQYVITCPHCGNEHRHSIGPGHRAAHCGPWKADSHLGYVIVEPTVATVITSGPFAGLVIGDATGAES